MIIVVIFLTESISYIVVVVVIFLTEFISFKDTYRYTYLYVYNLLQNNMGEIIITWKRRGTGEDRNEI